MMRRSRAREVALQLLYQRDLHPEGKRGQQVRFAKNRLRDAALQKFCLEIVEGVHANLKEIDSRLGSVAENWRLPRMAAVDRNILRMGTWEILYTPETPPAAAIDEAIELARRFGTVDSPRFVNGVLDKLKPQVAAAEEAPPAGPAVDQESMSADPVVPEKLTLPEGEQGA
ncbi:transcription antitermination factor NusB [soil metagenome]